MLEIVSFSNYDVMHFSNFFVPGKVEGFVKKSFQSNSEIMRITLVESSLTT